MGLLQGPRLMAWTTKSPIRGNHWVLLGCRALLGSVKISIVELFTGINKLLINQQFSAYLAERRFVKNKLLYHYS